MDFALLSGRLISAFDEDVAGYIEKRQEARCRQQCGRRLKSQLKHTVNSLTSFGGLMTVLGLLFPVLRSFAVLIFLLDEFRVGDTRMVHGAQT